MDKINTFTVAGTVERVDVFTTKTGKEIPTIILSTDGRFSQLIPLKVFHDVDAAKALEHGTELKVTGHLGGRDYNGRVYGDNVADKFEIISPSGRQQELPSGPPSDDDIGF